MLVCVAAVACAPACWFTLFSFYMSILLCLNLEFVEGIKKGRKSGKKKSFTHFAIPFTFFFHKSKIQTQCVWCDSSEHPYRGDCLDHTIKQKVQENKINCLNYTNPKVSYFQCKVTGMLQLFWWFGLTFYVKACSFYKMNMHEILDNSAYFNRVGK